MKHTIYFVRHGQCRGNVTGETLPPEEDVITDFGRKQAATLGEHLRAVQFTQAFASNYQRAIETAKGVLGKSDHQCLKPLKEDSRIKERELGDLIGQSTKDVVKMLIQQLSQGTRFNEVEIPGAETVEQYLGRQRSFFQELFDSLRHADKPETVLIVSHGLLMRRFLVGLNDGTFNDLCDSTNWSKKCASVVQNTACSIITVEFQDAVDGSVTNGNSNVQKGKPILTFEKVHDVGHLDNLPSEVVDGSSKSTFNVSNEDKLKFIEQVMKIPGAKEELSGCVQM